MEWLPVDLCGALVCVKPIKAPSYKLLQKRGEYSLWWGEIVLEDHFEEYGYDEEVDLEEYEVEELNEIVKKHKLYKFKTKTGYEDNFYTSHKKVKVFMIRRPNCDMYYNTWLTARGIWEWLLK